MSSVQNNLALMNGIAKVLDWLYITGLGFAWGDEAKGKVVFSLLERLTGIKVTHETFKGCYNFVMDLRAQPVPHNTIICARFNGGSNAGHTNVIPGLQTPVAVLPGSEPKYTDTVKTQSIPSGILVPGVVCIIGPECLVSLEVLQAEVQMLTDLGITDIRNRLIIASQCHVVTAKHKEQDKKNEENGKLNGTAIGTTCSGIGPCNADKANRTGFRVDSPSFFEEFSKLGLVMDIPAFFMKQADADVRGLKVVFEGAQAVELDITYGLYPYVTSSSTLQHQIYSLGLPRRVAEDNVILVLKAYDTYVGQAKGFEPPGEVFKKIRDVGHEYGSNTKRPRFVNYLDLTRLRRTIFMNATPNGRIIVVINKDDVLQTVSETFGKEAFGLYLEDSADGAAIQHQPPQFLPKKPHLCEDLADMRATIVRTLESYGVLREHIIFSDTPESDPSIWNGVF